MKKIVGWKTKGMNQDLSVSAFSQEFTFENINLRLSTNDGNTQMSWVNEKGTLFLSSIIIDIDPWIDSKDENKSDPVDKIEGTCIGTAVLNSKLVLFTTDTAQIQVDRIYVLWYSTDKTKILGKLLYKGNLNLNISNPLETLVSYEAEHIQKVYWTDNLNQPRLVNIEASPEVLKRWNTNSDGVDTFFDFIPVIQNSSTITVSRNNSGGLFAPGPIQYCFTYFNKYGQQSNIVDVSPLLYISNADRGLSPEEKSGNSFTITIENLDTNFDKLKIYSIQRTSLNSDVIVKEVATFDTKQVSQSTEIVTTLVYASAGEDLALPYKGGYIKTLIAKGGTYENIISSKVFISDGFVGTSDVCFRLGSGTGDFIMTFKEALTLGSTFLTYFSMYHMKYFSYFYFSGNTFSQIKQHYTPESSAPWFFCVGTNSLVEYGFYNKYFIYDYKEMKWYVSSSIATSEERFDGEIIETNITFTDTGTSGITIDPYELLFVGGKKISALTFKDKDNTLFLGNIKEDSSDLLELQKKITSVHGTEKGINIAFSNDMENKRVPIEISSSLYPYINQLSYNYNNITTFKGGETYRFGFQLQKKTGEWTEPIWVGDEKNTKYPNALTKSTNYINLVSAQATINVDLIKDTLGDIEFAKYSSIRPLVVYPEQSDKAILCQGVLNPTVFNMQDRAQNLPFAQSSWFFRPYCGQVNIPEEYWQDLDKSIKPTTTITSGSGRSRDEGFITEDITSIGILLFNCNESSIYIISQLQREKKVQVQVTDTYSGTITTKTIDLISIEEVAHNKFALISRDFFYPTYGGGIQYYGNYPLLQQNGSVVGVAVSQVYKDLVREWSIPLFYIKRSGDPNDAYIPFNIFEADSHYEIRYPCINKKAIIYNDSKGERVEFKHYASLPENNNSRCEVQGALSKSVDSPSDVEKTSSAFFVDQSILTMHSPDVEFNSEISNNIKGDWKLRIIGIVPITSNASSHSIIHNPLLQTDEGTFGTGDTGFNVYAGNMNLKGADRLIRIPWLDAGWRANSTTKSLNTFYVYPWHRNGALNNDSDASEDVASRLKVKKESTILFSIKSEYFQNGGYGKYNTNREVFLKENDFIYNIRLGRQANNATDVNYYPNIDKVITNDKGYLIPPSETRMYNPISMKYKSGSHIVLSLCTDSEYTPILPWIKYDNSTNGLGKLSSNELTHDNTFWGNSVYNQQGYLDISTMEFRYFSMLLLGELYRDDEDIKNRFGGNTFEAFQKNNWNVGGEAVELKNADLDGNITLNWTYGDTYYQRYDALKTYAYATEDQNQIVEILSFMCESGVNADGRYDRNRGQIDNTNISPRNFNLINDVYSQKDNFFTYKRISNEKESSSHPNTIVYSKTKENGADIDLWTNVTLASVLDLDGDKGKITKLTRFNDQLLCFQNKGLSQILYNENTQISTTEGVPIEIANSGKVQGKRYISDTIGCSNKWSVVNTPLGIYFMDSNNKGIYRFSGQLENISIAGGMNAWCKNNIPSSDVDWNPVGFNNFVSYYDKLNQDILFINKNTALAFNEKFGTFTSFYNYGNAPFFCSLGDKGIWVNVDNNKGDNVYRLWEHQSGDYCEFFGNNYGYSMTLIGNPEPQADKIFTNLEFRVTVDSYDSIYDTDIPFDTLETWDEYQHGIADIGVRLGHNAMIHHRANSTEASLIRKFRIWRCDIPRDNARVNPSEETKMGIYRKERHPMDRMRNPWLYLKLSHEPAEDESLNRAEIHDMLMTYYV